MAYTGRASLTSAAQASRSIDRQGHHSTIIAPISLSQKQLSQKDRASGAAIPLSLAFRDPETLASPQGGSLGAAG
jgi:hypothetical protein